jgi:alpha,alpha-trehalase
MTWSLAYEGFAPAQQGLREALTTQGNGYVFTRGAAPEAEADGVHYPGCYLAGGYNRLVTRIGEHEVENEDLVNLPNWLSLTFCAPDGPWYRPDAATIREWRQELDLRRGLLRRTLVVETEGKRTRIEECRFVHLRLHHLMGLAWTVTAENWSGRLTFRSALDGRVENRGVARYRELAGRHLLPLDQGAEGEEVVRLRMRTSQSRLELVQAARHRLFRGDRRLEALTRTLVEEGRVGQELACEVQAGEAVRLEKVVALFTSRDRAIAEPGLAALSALERAPRFDALVDSHATAWEQLWQRADLEVEVADGDRRIATILHLHLFHLLQTAGPASADLDVGLPARGWTGEAYRGHVFWDELFVLPVLTWRAPELARASLLYRFRRLGEARAAARAEGHEGAMFPWQSGSDGREETQRLHLNPHSGRWLPDNSHLQRHVGAAIAYNLWRHWQTTGDLAFLAAHGAEMLLEIARFLASLCRHDKARDRYEILGVMGPDEYHDSYPDRDRAGLDNNAYTNLMTVWTLLRALEVLEILPNERRRELEETLGLGPETYERWRDITRKMRLCFTEDGLLAQFEGFDRLLPFDWEGARARHGDVQRLDRILEAEGDTANRYQVAKQADVLMLFYLFSAEELASMIERLGYPFDPADIPRTVRHYLDRTAHGSTLSRVVHSWVLARSDRPRSFELFAQALESDVADIQGGTTPEGIHLGAMAGTVDLLQQGYTGLEARPDGLWLNPSLPDVITRLRFHLDYRGHGIEVRIGRERLEVLVHRDTPAPVPIGYRDERRLVAPGESTVFTLVK